MNHLSESFIKAVINTPTALERFCSAHKDDLKTLNQIVQKQALEILQQDPEKERKLQILLQAGICTPAAKKSAGFFSSISSSFRRVKKESPPPAEEEKRSSPPSVGGGAPSILKVVPKKAGGGEGAHSSASVQKKEGLSQDDKVLLQCIKNNTTEEFNAALQFFRELELTQAGVERAIREIQKIPIQGKGPNFARSKNQLEEELQAKLVMILSAKEEPVEQLRESPPTLLRMPKKKALNEDLAERIALQIEIGTGTEDVLAGLIQDRDSPIEDLNQLEFDSTIFGQEGLEKALQAIETREQSSSRRGTLAPLKRKVEKGLAGFQKASASERGASALGASESSKFDFDRNILFESIEKETVQEFKVILGSLDDLNLTEDVVLEAIRRVNLISERNVPNFGSNLKALKEALSLKLAIIQSQKVEKAPLKSSSKAVSEVSSAVVEERMSADDRLISKMKSADAKEINALKMSDFIGTTGKGRGRALRELNANENQKINRDRIRNVFKSISESIKGEEGGRLISRENMKVVLCALIKDKLKVDDEFLDNMSVEDLNGISQEDLVDIREATRSRDWFLGNTLMTLQRKLDEALKSLSSSGAVKKASSPREKVGRVDEEPFEVLMRTIRETSDEAAALEFIAEREALEGLSPQSLYEVLNLALNKSYDTVVLTLLDLIRRKTSQVIEEIPKKELDATTAGEDSFEMPLELNGNDQEVLRLIEARDGEGIKRVNFNLLSIKGLKTALYRMSSMQFLEDTVETKMRQVLDDKVLVAEFLGKIEEGLDSGKAFEFLIDRGAYPDSLLLAIIRDERVSLDLINQLDNFQGVSLEGLIAAHKVALTDRVRYGVQLIQGFRIKISPIIEQMRAEKKALSSRPSAPVSVMPAVVVGGRDLEEACLGLKAKLVEMQQREDLENQIKVAKERAAATRRETQGFSAEDDELLRIIQSSDREMVLNVTMFLDGNIQSFSNQGLNRALNAVFDSLTGEMQQQVSVRITEAINILNPSRLLKIGDKASVDIIKDPENPLLGRRVDSLKNGTVLNCSYRFNEYRKIRGDGNCFYRGILVGLLEQIMDPKNLSERRLLCEALSERIRSAKILPDDKKERLVTFLKRIEIGEVSWDQFNEVINQEDGVFDRDLMTFARCLECEYILANRNVVIRTERGRTPTEDVTLETAILEEAAVNGTPYDSLEQFCFEMILTDGAMAEGTVKYANTFERALGVNAVSVLVTRSPSGGDKAFAPVTFVPNLEKFPGFPPTESNLPYQRNSLNTMEIVLVFRPGHYDLLYKA